MPILLIPETKQALGNNANQCDSRSLFQDRFADPQAKEGAREKWFKALIGKKNESITRADWFPPPTELLHARLMSRLALNLSDGVMENAHVLLDRYGLPIIPGSAIKGCARRMALQALHDWVAAGTDRPAEDDACAPCCESFTSPAEMLAAIAHVFGWVEQDWKAGKKDELFCSDLAWTCGETHESIWAEACQIIAQRQNWKLPAEKPWKQLPDFAGTIAFVEAQPNRDPGLELDVVTPHHTEYYRSDDLNLIATDTEDPVPIFFPTVKAQGENEYFTFPLIPLRPGATEDLTHAKRWLTQGLELFGLGGKTAAGYGWFEDISKKIEDEINDEKELASVQANKEITKELQSKSEDQLRGILNKFAPEDEKFWPEGSPESTYEFQITLLELYLSNPEQLDIAMGMKKAKKGLQNLAKKFNRSLP